MGFAGYLYERDERCGEAGRGDRDEVADNGVGDEIAHLIAVGLLKVSGHVHLRSLARPPPRVIWQDKNLCGQGFAVAVAPWPITRADHHFFRCMGTPNQSCLPSAFEHAFGVRTSGVPA